MDDRGRRAVGLASGEAKTKPKPATRPMQTEIGAWVQYAGWTSFVVNETHTHRRYGLVLLLVNLLLVSLTAVWYTEVFVCTRTRLLYFVLKEGLQDSRITHQAAGVMMKESDRSTPSKIASYKAHAAYELYDLSRCRAAFFFLTVNRDSSKVYSTQHNHLRTLT